MLLHTSRDALSCSHLGPLAWSGKRNSFRVPLRSTYHAAYSASASFSGVRLAATPASEQQLPIELNLPDINALDLGSAKEGLAVLQQYGGKAADVAGAALGSAVSPFQLFGGAWFLNFMFFAVLGVMTYSLLVLAPRQ